nr:heavy metal-associated isoprenylated plant protein 3-like [Ipomoea batatas]
MCSHELIGVCRRRARADGGGRDRRTARETAGAENRGERTGAAAAASTVVSRPICIEEGCVFQIFKTYSELRWCSRAPVNIDEKADSDKGDGDSGKAKGGDGGEKQKKKRKRMKKRRTKEKEAMVEDFEEASEERMWRSLPPKKEIRRREDKRIAGGEKDGGGKVVWLEGNRLQVQMAGIRYHQDRYPYGCVRRVNQPFYTYSHPLKCSSDEQSECMQYNVN